MRSHPIELLWGLLQSNKLKEFAPCMAQRQCSVWRSSWLWQISLPKVTHFKVYKKINKPIVAGGMVAPEIMHHNLSPGTWRVTWFVKIRCNRVKDHEKVIILFYPGGHTGKRQVEGGGSRWRCRQRSELSRWDPHQGSPGATRAGNARKDSPLESKVVDQQLDFRLVVSRTMKELISSVLSHQAVVICESSLRRPTHPLCLKYNYTCYWYTHSLQQ